MMSSVSKALKDDGARRDAISLHDRSILVEAGAGISIIDPLTACSYKGRDVKFIPFEPAVACEYSMVVSNRHSSTLLLKPFIDMARAEAKRILPRKWVLRA